MGAPRFYLDAPLAVGAHLALPAAVFNHAMRVLRLKPGAPLVLFNGDGADYGAVVVRASRREAAVEITHRQPRATESPLAITLAQGVAKGERMDYSLQKAVELGVDAICPLWTQHAAVKLDAERCRRKHQHWWGVVVAACEQCGRARLPALALPRDLGDWLSTLDPKTCKLLLDPGAPGGLDCAPRAADPVVLLVGPEGGLSAAEVELAKAAGFVGARLGPRILRTETAGVVALALLQLLWGDLGTVGEP
ncbi:MAG: 16S rRNA (uracil(1498)-N(3))-methyltransferase [Candidatus Competibacterales bacterium]